MSDWKAYAKAGVAAAKTFEMDKSRMLLAMLSDANPADENLEAVLLNHHVFHASALAREVQSVHGDAKKAPTLAEATALIKKLESDDPVWHAMEDNKFLTGPECAIRSPFSARAPALCPRSCPHAGCPGGGDWVLCDWCYGFFCENCGAPRPATLWPSCPNGGTCLAPLPTPPSPEVPVLPLFRVTLSADALLVLWRSVSHRGPESMLRFAKKIKECYAEITAGANTAAFAASALAKDADVAKALGIVKAPTVPPGLASAPPGPDPYGRSFPSSFITPPARGALAAVSYPSQADYGFGATPGAPVKSRDFKELTRSNIMESCGGKRWPSALNVEYMWADFAETLMSDTPTYPAISATHEKLLGAKKAPASGVTFYCLLEWLLAAYNMSCGELGSDTLSMFSGVGAAADEILVRVAGDANNKKAGLDFVTMLAFYKYLANICIQGNADDEQTRTFILKTVDKLRRMLSRRHPTEDRLFCSPRQTFQELMLADLELPAKAVKTVSTPLTSAYLGKGGGRGGSAAGGSHGGRGGGSGSSTWTKPGYGKSSAPTDSAPKKRFGDGDRDDGSRPSKKSGKAVAPPSRTFSLRDFDEDEDEPVEYQIDEWGGNDRSKLACFAFCFDNSGCTRGDACGWSHRPSICFRERANVRAKKGWDNPPKPNPRFREVDGTNDSGDEVEDE